MMSMTEDEARYEQWLDELYREHSEQAIEEFIADRLQSFYLQNPIVAEPAAAALVKAREYFQNDPTVALILAAISMEVVLRIVLLKPIVFGLVNNEPTAGLITDIVLTQNFTDKFGKFLLKILNEHGGVDLKEWKRSGLAKGLWEEIKEVRDKRNPVIHSAETVSADQAAQAIDVASELLERVFPAVVQKLSLHLHDGVRVCNNKRCGSKYAELIEEIERKQREVQRN
jgi:hypothetical protein